MRRPGFGATPWRPGLPASPTCTPSWTAPRRPRAVRPRPCRAAKLQDVDRSVLLVQIRGAESTNRLVRENHQRTAVAAEQAVAERQAGELTQQIEAVDQQKADAIAAVRMPVPGLGFGADGVARLNGLPLEQASAAERLRVLLIRDASLLDRTSMRLIAEMAHQAGAQLWVERVEVDDQTTVVIEDVALRAVALASPAAG